MPCTAAATISPARTPSTAAGWSRRRRATRSSRSSESTVDAPRDGRPPRTTRRGAAGDESRGEQHELGRQLGERRAVERSRDDERQQGRLDQHESCRAESDERRPPRRAHGPIEHGRGGAGRAPASSPRASTSESGAGAWIGSSSRLVATDPRPEYVVRPALVEQDQRHEDQRDDAHHLRACSAPTRRRRR